MGTRIPFGRRTWRAKWSHGEEHIQHRQLRVEAVPAARWALGVWDSQVSWHWPLAQQRAQGPVAQAADGHSEIQQESRPQLEAPRISNTACEGYKTPQFALFRVSSQRHWLRLLFGFAPPLNFKDLDAWDIYGTPGAEAIRRPCLAVKCGAHWEPSKAPLGHWSCCHEQASVPAQVVKCDQMVKEQSFFNSYRV